MRPDPAYSPQKKDGRKSQKKKEKMSQKKKRGQMITAPHLFYAALTFDNTFG